MKGTLAKFLLLHCFRSIKRSSLSGCIALIEALGNDGGIHMVKSSRHVDRLYCPTSAAANHATLLSSLASMHGSWLAAQHLPICPYLTDRAAFSLGRSLLGWIGLADNQRSQDRVMFITEVPSPIMVFLHCCCNRFGIYQKK